MMLVTVVSPRVQNRVPLMTTVSQNGTTATVARTDIAKKNSISRGDVTLFTRDIVW